MGYIKNNMAIVVYYSFFILYSLFCISNSGSFEVGENEMFELFDADYTLSSHFNLSYDSDPLSPDPDRGLLFPLLVKVITPYIGYNIYHLRIFNLIFYLLSIHLLYLGVLKDLSTKVRVFSAVFLSFNYMFFSFSTLISPYALNFFLTLIFYMVHFNFSGSRNSHIIHSVSGLIAVLSFFTSALPIAISIFVLHSLGKIKIKKYFYFYIPLLSYISFKSVLIVKFRFIESQDIYNPLNHSLASAGKYLLNFFNIYLYGKASFLFEKYPFLVILNIFYMLALLYVFSKFVIYFFKSKTPLNIFVKYYFILMIVSYVLMVASPASEIEMRYYFHFLPLFYMSFFLYVLEFLERSKITISLLVSSLLLLTFLNFSHYKNLRTVPFITISKYIFPKIKKNDLFCIPEHLNSGSQHWRLGMSWEFKGMFSYKKIKNIILCKNYLRKLEVNDKIDIGDIYIGSLEERFDRDNFCTKNKSDFCSKPNFINELKLRKVERLGLIPSYRSNLKVYIDKYSKE